MFILNVFDDLSMSFRIFHHQQTLKEMKEVLHCLELNQRDFVETIDVSRTIVVLLYLNDVFF